MPMVATARSSFDMDAIRADFPALQLKRDDKPLVFLDSGASAQKPKAVIERMVQCMHSGYANVHRGQYYLSETATQDYEAARAKVAAFIGAQPKQIVFTSNATAAINLAAYGYAAHYFGAGDSVLFSALEHHANIVPWQMAAQQAGFDHHVIPLDGQGNIDLDAAERLLQQHRVRLVAIAHVSNVLGSIADLNIWADLAHRYGALLLVDGCQGIVHQAVDINTSGVDFYCASGHKLYGPSGIGVLYARPEHLHAMRPMLGGGDMIKAVAYDHSTFAEPPALFEAGTPPIIEAIGLGAAIDYINGIGMSAIIAHEAELGDYLLSSLRQIPEITVWGDADHRSGIASLSVAGAHPQDVGQMLDRLSGVAVRAGHHCAMPLHGYWDIPSGATVRASLGMYNIHDDVDALCDGLRRVISII